MNYFLNMIIAYYITLFGSKEFFLAVKAIKNYLNKT